MPLTFTESEIPQAENAYVPTVNPFYAIVKEYNEKRGKAFKFTVSGKNAEDLDKVIAKHKLALRRTAADQDVTVRTKVEKSEKGNSATVKCWVKDREKRARKGKAEVAE